MSNIKTPLKTTTETYYKMFDECPFSMAILQNNMFKHVNQHFSNTIGYSLEEIESLDLDKFIKIIFFDKKIDIESKKKEIFKDPTKGYDHEIVNKNSLVILFKN